MELMSDPVMVATGHTYDRSCIEKWLAQGNRTCPVTGMRLRHLELTPNHALRNAIQVRCAARLQHNVGPGPAPAPRHPGRWARVAAPAPLCGALRRRRARAAALLALAGSVASLLPLTGR